MYLKMKVLKKLIDKLLKPIKKDNSPRCHDCERWGKYGLS